MPLKFETQTQSRQDPVQSGASPGARQPPVAPTTGPWRNAGACGRAQRGGPGGLGQGVLPPSPASPLHLLGERREEEAGRRFGTGGDHMPKSRHLRGGTGRCLLCPGGSPHPAPAWTNPPSSPSQPPSECQISQLK